MKKTRIIQKHVGLFPALLAIAAMVAAPCVFAQGTAFTYQGQLDDAGYAADGSYDMEFKVWNASAGGAQVGGTATYFGIPVEGGLFTRELAFGSGVFTGADRWLEIGVQTNGGGGFTTLTPRTKFTSTPYAIKSLSAQTAQTAQTASSVAGGINDADADPANELNTSVIFAGNILEVTDAAGTLSADLAALIDDADANPANELNTTVSLSGTTLKVIDAGGTKSANLASLVDDSDWAYFSGSGLSGEIYHSGDVALGTLTDPDGHGLNVQNYVNGRAAVRGANESSGLYAAGFLGVLSPTDPPIGIPIDTVNAGVVGIKYNDGADGIGVMGWNNDAGSVNYGGAFVADGSGSQNIALYAKAENGTGNLAGLFDGTGYATANSDGLVNIGSSDSRHITYDADDIQAMNNTNTTTLYLNYFGGNVDIASGGGTTYIGSGNDVIVSSSGDVGINRSPSTYGFEVQGDVGMYDTDINMYASDGSQSVYLNGDSYGYLQLYNDAGNARAYIGGDISDAGYAAFYTASGSASVQIYGDYAGTGDGRVITDELEITGGSDLSEQFDVDGSACDVKPGMVVCIDPDNPGKLAVSTKAYDKRVAGIVSGADGVKPGLLMGQEGSVANGEYPVALTGRVYCMADASQGAIESGDLITTSPIPGHGMKVLDHSLAQGAIIGKAMTPLANGQGMVLVLVSLQ